MDATVPPARRRFLRNTAATIGAILVASGNARQARAGDSALAMRELYDGSSVLGLQLSPKARGLKGQRVQVLGYLAPPLKPDVQFFVLTRAPVSLCPYCNSDADWPADTVVVYPRDRGQWQEDGRPVAVSGILELGSKVDQETGFVSLVRLVEADVTMVK